MPLSMGGMGGARSRWAVYRVDDPGSSRQGWSSPNLSVGVEGAFTIVMRPSPSSSPSSGSIRRSWDGLGWIFTVVGLDWPRIRLIAVEPVASLSKPSGHYLTHTTGSAGLPPPADGL